MTFPIALGFISAAYWPLIPTFAAVAMMLGVLLRGAWQVVCFVVAGLLLADVILTFRLVLGM